MNAAVEQLRAAVELILRHGRAEGIEASGPLGLWLTAQAEALHGFACILDDQADRFDTTLGKIEAASQAELEKLARAIELAKESVKQANLAVHQSRNAQLAATVQQESVVQRMIKETLPLFAKTLDGALVIRETRWNRRRARIGFAYTGLLFLGVFIGGYGLSTWSDQGPLAAYGRCLASTISANGHSYCQVDNPTSRWFEVWRATSRPPVIDKSDSGGVTKTE